MQSVRWIVEKPILRRPVLVVAFEGWNDAGDAATTAAGHVIDRFSTEPFAQIDPEPFYDFSTARPIIRLTGDGGRTVDWPSNEFTAAVLEGSERDLVVLTGIEPQLKWRTFSTAIAAVASELGADLVVSLGALIADVAHSRPITVYGTSNNAKLCEQLQLEPSTYEGPTGIVGVLHHACQEAGLASMSLWAAIPSYVPHAPSPKAALALVARLGEILGLDMETEGLAERSAEYERQITELVSDDHDTSSYVSKLEEQYDASMTPESTAELIEELEQFLKDQ